jgi:hypothetical protein
MRNHSAPSTTGRRPSTRRRRLAAAVVGVVIGTSLVGSGPVDGTPAGGAGNRFEVTVLSSEPDQVSGGDALIEVTVPRGTRTDAVRVTVGGTDVTGAFTPDGRTLTGSPRARTPCGSRPPAREATVGRVPPRSR